MTYVRCAHAYRILSLHYVVRVAHELGDKLAANATSETFSQRQQQPALLISCRNLVNANEMR